MSSKVTFSATMDKIFGTSSSFRVKYRVAGKFGYLYFPAHGLGPGPQFVFITRLGPQFVLNCPSPQFPFTSTGSQFVFTGPGLQLYNHSGVRTGKYKFWARAGKYKLGTRAGKYRLGGRAGKYRLGARAGKSKLGTRAGKSRLGARAGKCKLRSGLGSKQKAEGREIRRPGKF